MGLNRNTLVLGLVAIAIVIVVVALLASAINNQVDEDTLRATFAAEGSATALAALPTSTPPPDVTSIRETAAAEFAATETANAPTPTQTLQEGDLRSTIAAEIAGTASAQAPTQTPFIQLITATPELIAPIIVPTSPPIIITATQEPQSQPPSPTRRPTREAPEAPRPTTSFGGDGSWSDGVSFQAQNGSVALGNPAGWVVFQGWNGSDVGTTVHGLIEPGFSVSIPAPFRGTMWVVTNINNDTMTNRVLAMREEVNMSPSPPLYYIGVFEAPDGYESSIPSAWRVTSPS